MGYKTIKRHDVCNSLLNDSGKKSIYTHREQLSKCDKTLKSDGSE